MPEAPATQIPAMASLHADDDPAAPRKVVFGDAIDRAGDNLDALRAAAVALAAEAAALRLRAAALETRATDLEARATALEAETADIRADFAAADAGLQTQIDAKAAAAHTHAQGEVTGLATALTGKADLAGDTFTGAVTFDAAVTCNGALTAPVVNFDATGSIDIITDKFWFNFDASDHLRYDRTNNVFTFFIGSGSKLEVSGSQVLVPTGSTLRLNGPVYAPGLQGAYADNAAATAAGLAIGAWYHDTQGYVRRKF